MIIFLISNTCNIFDILKNINQKHLIFWKTIPRLLDYIVDGGKWIVDSGNWIVESTGCFTRHYTKVFPFFLSMKNL